MRVLIQRVSRAAVRVRDGNEERVAGRIDRGLVLLVGFQVGDATHAEESLSWMTEKIVGLRIFGDAEEKMNLALGDVQGALLVVSQFTLYGDVHKGRRPSFVTAAKPEEAEPLYRRFLDALRGRGAHVESGEFGAMMEVELVNDGPVTLWVER
jgi:D-aminoacyl-tRNA deacylase